MDKKNKHLNYEDRRKIEKLFNQTSQSQRLLKKSHIVVLP